METTKKASLFYKVFSLLSVVRGYNVIVLVAAQYLASIFIFSREKSIRYAVFDLHLFFIILASVCVVSAGYIINDFYDSKADKINRPYKVGLDNYISQKTKLTIYFTLNFIGTVIAYLTSWKAALFFLAYMFGIWFYSHKLKKYPLTGLISATILVTLPFFAVFVYFKNFSKIIFAYAVFLFLVIMVRELIKDLENMKGAVVNNYKTFPIAYGERNTKFTSIFLLIFTLIPVIYLLNYPEITYMKYYFYVAIFSLIIVGIVLIKANKKRHYTILHNALKLLLLLGVFSLVFMLLLRFYQFF